jgi:hypothetical protein
MGCVNVRKDFADEHHDLVNAFLDEYGASIDYVKNNVDEAAAMVAQYGITASEEIAKAAIPDCNLTFVTAPTCAKKSEVTMRPSIRPTRLPSAGRTQTTTSTMSPDASGKLLRGLLARRSGSPSGNFPPSSWAGASGSCPRDGFCAAVGAHAHRRFLADGGDVLGRVFLGFLGGVALGTVLAALTAASRVCDVLLSPAVRVVRATPVASFIVLLLLWMNRKRGFVPAVMAGLMVMPVLWGNVRKGIASRDGALLEVARVLRNEPLQDPAAGLSPRRAALFVSGCVTPRWALRGRRASPPRSSASRSSPSARRSTIPKSTWSRRPFSPGRSW